MVSRWLMGTEFDEFESFQAVASQGFRLLSLFGCNKQSQRISSDLEGKGILHSYHWVGSWQHHGKCPVSISRAFYGRFESFYAILPFRRKFS